MSLNYLFDKEYFSMGIPVLDRFLSPGILKCSVIEVWGVEGIGKSTFAYALARSALMQGGHAVFEDAENAMRALGPHLLNLFGMMEEEFSDLYTSNLEDTVGRIYINANDTLEGSLANAVARIRAIRENKPYAKGDPPIVVVYDSMAAALPIKQLKDSVGKSRGYSNEQSRIWPTELRKINRLNNDELGALWVFINHERKEFNAKNPAYAAPVTPGGATPKFFFTLRLRLGRGTLIKTKTEGGKTVGRHVFVNIIKHRQAAPARSIELPVIGKYGYRPDRIAYALLRKAKLIPPAGGWLGDRASTLNLGGGFAKKKISFKDWTKFYADNSKAVEQLIEKHGLGKEAE